MDPSTRIIPPLRGDVDLVDSGEERLPFAVLDKTLGQKLKLDRQGAMLASALDREWPAGQLLTQVNRAGLHMGPDLLVRFIRFLDAHFLLDSERAARHIAAVRASDEAAERPIRFLPGTQHDCVACGASCGGHDVGPIAEPQAAAIKAQLPDARFLERRTGDASTSGCYCAMADDMCAMLRPDRLCSIHAALGVDHKPTDCRVFPLTFTRTPQEVVVGVRMECRSYIASKRNGGALSGRGPELERLLAGMDEINEVPPLVRLDQSVTLPYSDYLALECELLDAVVQPVVWQGLTAMNALARQRIEDARDADLAGQIFPIPTSPEPECDAAGVIEAIELGCEMAARMNAAAGNVQRASRLERVGRAAGRLTASIPAPPLDADSEELLVDHLRQSLFAKEPLNGPHLRFGLGILNLSILLAIAGLEESEHLNGALADALKTLRAGPVLGRLHDLDGAVAAWFHHDLEHWAPGC